MSIYWSGYKAISIAVMFSCVVICLTRPGSNPCSAMESQWECRTGKTTISTSHLPWNLYQGHCKLITTWQHATRSIDWIHLSHTYLEMGINCQFCGSCWFILLDKQVVGAYQSHILQWASIQRRWGREMPSTWSPREQSGMNHWTGSSCPSLVIGKVAVEIRKHHISQRFYFT